MKVVLERDGQDMGPGRLGSRGQRVRTRPGQPEQGGRLAEVVPARAGDLRGGSGVNRCLVAFWALRPRLVPRLCLGVESRGEGSGVKAGPHISAGPLPLSRDSYEVLGAGYHVQSGPENRARKPDLPA